MHELAASGPSSLAVSLFVGTYVTILAAALGTCGYIVRYLGGRFKRIDDDNEAIIVRVATVEHQLPPLSDRVKVVEKGHKQTRKTLDRISWILEARETERVATTSTVATRTRNAPPR